MDHRNNFNLLRLLAASQVVLMHSFAHLHLPVNSKLFWIASQFSGVACFFVISGFLVSDSFLRSPTTGTFFANRAIRIYPALVVNIVILEFLMFVAGQLPGAHATYPAYLAVYALTASSDIGALFASGMYSYSGFFEGYPSQVLWTLTVELCFYLFLPLMLQPIVRWRKAGIASLLGAMAGSFAIAFAATDQFYNDHPMLNISVFPYFWVFGIGIIARIFWDKISFLFEGKVLIWLVIYGAVDAITILYFGADSWLEYKLHPGWTGLFRIVTMGGVVLSAAYSFKGLTSWLRLSKLDLSYGLYLWHMLVVMTLLGLGYSKSPWLWAVVYGAGLSLAALSWFLIERPALKYKKPHTRAADKVPQEILASAGS